MNECEWIEAQFRGLSRPRPMIVHVLSLTQRSLAHMLEEQRLQLDLRQKSTYTLTEVLKMFDGHFSRTKLLTKLRDELNLNGGPIAGVSRENIFSLEDVQKLRSYTLREARFGRKKSRSQHM